MKRFRVLAASRRGERPRRKLRVTVRSFNNVGRPNHVRVVCAPREAEPSALRDHDWARQSPATRTKALADAIADLDEDQKSRSLNPPYTIGSAMIWPIRTKDPHTMNRARRSNVGDRMHLIQECIRHHYTGEPGSPLAEGHQGLR